MDTKWIIAWIFFVVFGFVFAAPVEEKQERSKNYLFMILFSAICLYESMSSWISYERKVVNQSNILQRSILLFLESIFLKKNREKTDSYIVCKCAPTVKYQIYFPK